MKPYHGWSSQGGSGPWFGVCNGLTGANGHSWNCGYHTCNWFHNLIFNTKLRLKMGLRVRAGMWWGWVDVYFMWYIILMNNNCASITGIICVSVSKKKVSYIYFCRWFFVKKTAVAYHYELHRTEDLIFIWSSHLKLHICICSFVMQMFNFLRQNV